MKISWGLSCYVEKVLFVQGQMKTNTWYLIDQYNLKICVCRIFFFKNTLRVATTSQYLPYIYNSHVRWRDIQIFKKKDKINKRIAGNPARS